MERGNTPHISVNDTHETFFNIKKKLLLFDYFYLIYLQYSRIKNKRNLLDNVNEKKVWIISIISSYSPNVFYLTFYYFLIGQMGPHVKEKKYSVLKFL